MEPLIKNSIDARYNAFSNFYTVEDDKVKAKIEELFKKINALGEESKDVMDFESKFASSPLNSEYTKLFTEIASSSTPVAFESEVTPVVKDDKEYLVEEVKSDAEYLMDDLTQPIRRKAREEFDSRLRDTPLGTIEQVDNMHHLFNKWFKKGE